MAIVVSVLREVEREARVRLFVFTTYILYHFGKGLMG
jgi:hypothetical protein